MQVSKQAGIIVIVRLYVKGKASRSFGATYANLDADVRYAYLNGLKIVGRQVGPIMYQLRVSDGLTNVMYTIWKDEP